MLPGSPNKLIVKTYLPRLPSDLRSMTPGRSQVAPHALILSLPLLPHWLHHTHTFSLLPFLHPSPVHSPSLSNETKVPRLPGLYILFEDITLPSALNAFPPFLGWLTLHPLEPHCSIMYSTKLSLTSPTHPSLRATEHELHRTSWDTSKLFPN